MRDEPLRTGEDVVREVLVALAPGELTDLASVLQAYRIAPWTLAGDRRDRPASWSPFVLGFVAETVVGLGAPDSAAGGGRRRFAALLDRWRPGPDERLANVPDTPVPAFDARQLRQVWASAMDAATERDYPLGDREAFAAAVVAALAVGHLPQPRRASAA